MSTAPPGPASPLRRRFTARRGYGPLVLLLLAVAVGAALLLSLGRVHSPQSEHLAVGLAAGPSVDGALPHVEPTRSASERLAERDRLETLLREGMEHLVAGRLDAPPGENALESFELALEMDPASLRGRRGMELVQRRLELRDRPGDTRRSLASRRVEAPAKPDSDSASGADSGAPVMRLQGGSPPAGSGGSGANSGKEAAQPLSNTHIQVIAPNRATPTPGGSVPVIYIARSDLAAQQDEAARPLDWTMPGEPQNATSQTATPQTARPQTSAFITEVQESIRESIQRDFDLVASGQPGKILGQGSPTPDVAATATPRKPSGEGLAQGLAEILPSGKEYLILTLERGPVVFELFRDSAPRTVEAIVKLAQQGFYNGLTFHRVEPGLLVQGGCPRADGTGGPGFTLPAEFSRRPHQRGTLSMARMDDPNSAGSQFFVCLTRLEHLDGKYTVFGDTYLGMESIAAVQPRDRILRAEYADRR